MDYVMDPEHLRELAEVKEEENWRFRYFLKGADYSPEEVDQAVHRLYSAISADIDCLECGNCCREVAPSLSWCDVKRLADALGCATKSLVMDHLMLADQPAKFLFRETACPFLSDNCCTVYEVRPGTCRSYPHLHKDDFVFRLISVVQTSSVCPIVYHVYEQLKEELWLQPRWPDEDWSGLY